MILDPTTLAQMMSLAFLAAVGHLASLLIGIVDSTRRRDRSFGVMILFILLCSPAFFDNRPHDLAMMTFAFACYLVPISWLERERAESARLKKLLGISLVGSCILGVAALVYLAVHLPTVQTPRIYALTLLARNVVLFLLLTRGAYFAFQQKNLRGFVALYVLMLLLAPFLMDFALSVCGPLLAIGCLALGTDLRRLRQRLTL